LDVGKLPADLLARLLARNPVRDPRVLVGPAPGEDAAAIAMGDRVLVAKTDPITFATDEIGWYAVNINANDLATMGATPRWFLVTVLLPEGAAERLAETIFEQITTACADLGIALVGGHTEITYDLGRPVVVGCLLGEAEPGDLLTSGGARPGDTLLLTKGIAVEGTAILAREARPALQSAGLADDLLDRAAGFLREPGISVVRDALVARCCGGVHAMHDPTEGGLATGLRELAAAARAGVRLDAGAVPILPETEAVCAALGLDPLGLIASGALLIAAEAQRAPELLACLRGEGIAAAAIGEMTPAEDGLWMQHRGERAPLPLFARDEVARYFAPDR